MNKIKNSSQFRWIVTTLIFFVYTIAAADRANIGVVLPFIRNDFHMSNTEAGALASLFLLAYAIAQIPSGFLYSKFGVRKIFSLSMILTSLATGLVGFSTSILGLKVSRFILGLAEGPLPIGITSTINRWFPSREKGIVTSIFLSAAKFGPVLVPPICAFILYHYSWHYVFYFFAIPGIFLSVIWYLLVPNTPQESRFCSESEIALIEERDNVSTSSANTVTQKKILPVRRFTLLDKLIRAKKVKLIDNSKGIFRSWNILGSTLGYFFMMGIVNVLLAWIPTYLMNEKGFSIIKMGMLASAPWVGAVIGNIIGGWCSDRILNKRRKPLMMLSAIATVIMMVILINAPDNPMILGPLLLLTGILFNLGFSAYMVYPMSLTTKDVFPVAGALINTGGQLGGAVCPLVAGYLLDHYTWGHVFGFMALGSFLCLLVLFTISEPLSDDQIDQKAA
ncbi:MFS transporter [Pectobacterium zantedeschiae]|uniref:MFS transporter n=1 Tax=Pectobacterium zantedeschiae TaxID=2034769 RepID=A0A9X8JKZ0_9GAMM|nr:MFS transporter [Pectobacterium zantedeschiae]RYC42333.1 MFS transporter [Pectobacterium zantedeschiae]RYC45571.1 MFS transporter [Pectobacterium zantedeschiae]